MGSDRPTSQIVLARRRRTSLQRVSVQGVSILRCMAVDVVYTFRVMRLPLLHASGAKIGKVANVVIVPGLLVMQPGPSA